MVNVAKDLRNQNPLASAQALSSRIATINEIAVAINRSLNSSEIFQIFGKKSKWLLDFTHLSIYLPCSGSKSPLINLFGPSLTLSQINRLKRNPINTALASGQPQLIHRSDDMFWPDHSAAMVIPLEHQMERFGAIVFSSTTPTAYSLDDIRVGYLLGLQLSSALQNAKRFEEINRLYAVLEEEQRRSENLLLNILPAAIAKELRNTGKVDPVHYECASVLFADFKGFTKLSEYFGPEILVNELDACFSYFDEIVEKYGLEKLKTIGDGYMCVGGIPTPNPTHAIDAVLAALEMQMFIRLRKNQKRESNQPYWNIRIGIHSGPVMAGIIGRKKFAYDVWGNTVNVASRMESFGVPGRVNVSKATADLVKCFFNFEHRGDVLVKDKGYLEMHLVEGIRRPLSRDAAGTLPNGKFVDRYKAINPDTEMDQAPRWLQTVSS
ncbi:MAG: adenylate/guanylate cyclase domain-containing protein [Elainellaceae cyanobacterium]